MKKINGDSGIHYFWRIKIAGRVFKLYVSSGYTASDMETLYRGAEMNPISEQEYLGG